MKSGRNVYREFFESCDRRNRAAEESRLDILYIVGVLTMFAVMMVMAAVVATGCSPQPQPAAAPLPTTTDSTLPTPDAKTAPPVTKEDNLKAAVGPVEVIPAKKLGLVIGINAYGNGNDLAGCVNDAKDWTAYLKAKGFEVETLLDKEASADAIRTACKYLAMGKVKGDEICIVFSGHGTQLDDPKDADGLDEAICAADVFADFEKNCIRGSEFRRWLDMIPEGVRVTVSLDSCHSATRIRDVKRKGRYLAPPNPVGAHRKVGKGAMPRDARPLLAFLAGCEASGTCADANIGGKPCGAFTHYVMLFLNLKANDIQEVVTKWLADNGFDQKPQIVLGPARSGKELFR